MTSKRGFIQIIIILILIVIILSLLGVSLTSLFSNSTLKENFKLMWDWAVFIWDKYLSIPFKFILVLIRQLILNPLHKAVSG